MAFAVEQIASTASNIVEYMDVTIRPERQKFYEGRSKVAAEQLRHGSFRDTLNTMMRQTERMKKGQLAFNVAKSMASRTKKNEEEEAHKPLMLGSFDVWALGITVVIGGQYFCWNFALAAGFGSCFLSMMLVGAAYVCLVVSNAELTSAMPFAGGAYGLARVSLGLWPGFMVGCCESVEYILYTASSALFLADLIQTTAGTDPFTIPIFIVVFYIVALLICIPGGHVFWKTNMFLAVVSFALLLMYNLGALKYINSKEYISALKTTGAVDDTTTRSTFIGGPKAFFTVFPLAGWYYVGVESLNMAASVVHEPRKTVPIGAIACVLTLVATAIFTVSVVPSLPPPTDDHFR
jgi:hypothetical protein